MEAAEARKRDNIGVARLCARPVTPTAKASIEVDVGGGGPIDRLSS